MPNNKKSKKGAQQKAKAAPTPGPAQAISKKLVQLQDAVNQLTVASKRKGGGGGSMSLGRLVDAGVTGIAKIFGMGDYTIEHNSLSDIMGKVGSASMSVPAFSPMANNRVRHRECLGMVLVPASTAFHVIKKLRFNPTDPNTFPWLKNMAGGYTSYRVHGAALVYESNTSEFSTTPYMGTVCIGTKYDTRESDFTSMMDMQNAKFSVSAKPSQHILHPLECKPGFQQVDTWLCRRGNETDTSFLYDKCNMYVATEGVSASVGTVLGRLWLTYDIELINPVMPLGQFVYNDRWASTWQNNTEERFGNAARAFTARDAAFTGPNLLEWSPLAVTDDTAVYLDEGNHRFVIRRPGLYVFQWNNLGAGLGTVSDTPLTAYVAGSAICEDKELVAVYTDTAHCYTLVCHVLQTSGDGVNYAEVSYKTSRTGTIAGQSIGISLAV